MTLSVAHFSIFSYVLKPFCPKNSLVSVANGLVYGKGNFQFLGIEGEKESVNS
jgi:hypothetical protein